VENGNCISDYYAHKENAVKEMNYNNNLIECYRGRPDVDLTPFYITEVITRDE
jgi:hypothetical protein